MRKKQLAGILIGLFLLTIISFVQAADPAPFTGAHRARHVQVDKFRFFNEGTDAGNSLTSMIRLENIGPYDIEDLKVTVYILDLGIRMRLSRDDMDRDDTLTVRRSFFLEESVEPGEYLAKITVENDNLRRNMYRYIFIE